MYVRTVDNVKNRSLLTVSNYKTLKVMDKNRYVIRNVINTNVFVCLRTLTYIENQTLKAYIVFIRYRTPTTGVIQKNSEALPITKSTCCEMAIISYKTGKI